MFSLKECVLIEELLDLIGLPKKMQNVKCEDILKAMRHDKKFISGKNRFVLPVRIGKVKVVEGIGLDLIEGAVRKYSC